MSSTLVDPGSAPALGTEWLQSLSRWKKEFSGTQESLLCLGGCIPGSRLARCWVKGSAACLLGLAKIPAGRGAWLVQGGCQSTERAELQGLALPSTGEGKNQVQKAE